MNSCLIFRDPPKSPKFHPRNSPPPSDRAITTVEGTPSARESARNCSNKFAASLLWRIGYTHVYRENSSRTMSIYRFRPRDSTTLGPLKSTRTLPSFKACVCGLLHTFAETLCRGAPFALQQQLSIEDNPVLLRGSSKGECPAAQWKSLMLIAELWGSSLGGITAHTFSPQLRSTR